MTGTLLSFSAAALAVRGLAGRLSISEILSIRSSFGVMILLLIAAVRPALWSQLAPRRMILHLWRNSVHFIGQYFWALSVTLLPLATVFALEFTMPIWVVVLAVPFLGERLTISRIGSIVLGFLGVLVIVRPGFASFQPIALLVLLAALAFALSLIATKQLTRDVSTYTILFWMNLMQLPMAFAASDPLFIWRLGFEHAPSVLAMGIAGLSSHYCLTNAFRAGDASLVVPMDFARIPLIAVIGWLFYGEALDIFVFAGALLIIAGVSWNLHAEARRAPPH